MLSKDDAAKLALSGYSKDDIIALGFDFNVSDNSDSNEKAAHEENTNESNKPDTNV